MVRATCPGGVLIKRHDRAELLVKPSSFDWLEGFTDSQANANIKWISEVSLEDCLNKTTNISAYCEFALAVGDRATEAIRIDATSNFFAVVGSGNGGEIFKGGKSCCWPQYHGHLLSRQNTNAWYGACRNTEATGLGDVLE